MLREHWPALFTCFCKKESKSFNKRQSGAKSFEIDFDGKASILGLVCQLEMIFFVCFKENCLDYLDILVQLSLPRLFGVGSVLMDYCGRTSYRRSVWVWTQQSKEGEGLIVYWIVCSQQKWYTSIEYDRANDFPLDILYPKSFVKSGLGQNGARNSFKM